MNKRVKTYNKDVAPSLLSKETKTMLRQRRLLEQACIRHFLQAKVNERYRPLDEHGNTMGEEMSIKPHEAFINSQRLMV